ncbi:unnamed protein product [Amoebophrya sp. A25]|nr:unnamed protein product [Amoebophrya sp. A25]|eukprot:GSA25T00014830001.1
MQSRDAVQRFYNLYDTAETTLATHGQLAGYFEKKYRELYGKKRLSSDDALLYRQTLSRLPYHTLRSLQATTAASPSTNCKALFLDAENNMRFLVEKSLNGLFGEFLLEFRKFRIATKIGEDGNLSSNTLRDFNEWYQGNAHVMRLFIKTKSLELCHVVRQQIANTRDDSEVLATCRGSKEGDKKADTTKTIKTTSGATPSRTRGPVFLNWRNKPQLRPEIEQVLQQPNGVWVWTAAVSPKNQYIALGCSDRLIHVLDFVSFDETLTLFGHTGELSHCAFVTNTILVTVAGCRPYRKENEIILWDVTKGSKLRQLSARGGCTSLVVSPENRNEGTFSVRASEWVSVYECGNMASAAPNANSSTTTLEVATAETGRSGQGCDVRSFEANTTQEQGDEAKTRKGKSYVFAAGSGSEIKLYRSDGGAAVGDTSSIEISTFPGHEDSIVDLRFLDIELQSQAGAPTTLSGRLVSASMDHSLRLWDLAKGTCLHCLKNAHSPETDLTALTVYSQLLGPQVGADKKSTKEAGLAAHGDRLSSGWMVITCADDKTLKVFECVSGLASGLVASKAPSAKSKATQKTSAITGTPKGKGATGSGQASKGASSDSTFQHLATLEGNASSVKSAQVITSGERCVSCSDDGVVRIYNLNVALANHRVRMNVVDGSSQGQGTSGGGGQGVKLPPILAAVGNTKASSAAVSGSNSASKFPKPRIKDHKPNAVSSCVLLTESHLASADVSGRVVLWELIGNDKSAVWSKTLRSANEMSMAAVSSIVAVNTTKQGDTSGTSTVDINRVLLFCAMFRVVHVVRASDGENLHSCAFPDWVNALSLGPSALVAGGDSFIVAWLPLQEENLAFLADLAIGKKKSTTESAEEAVRVSGASSADTFLPWHRATHSAAKASAKTAVLAVAASSKLIAKGTKGRYFIASGSNDHVVRLWDGGSAGVLLAQFTAESWVVSLCFTSEGAKSSDDGTAPRQSDSKHLFFGTQRGEIGVLNAADASEQMEAVVIRGDLLQGATIAWCEPLSESAIALATSDKMVYIVNINTTPAEDAATLKLVGFFPASGPFGSADGIGGQGSCWTRKRGSGDSALGTICIGDQTGELYCLDATH